MLYFRGIGDSWGNSYYSAAVKSMSQSFENFFFGSFDPAGVVTVDKPPMALWVQVLSVLAFGYGEFALLFPQALAGVVAVFLLHRTVRRWAGEHAALLAALVLALSPITVAINQDNNPDTLLVLLVVGAAYAMTRSVGPVASPSRATAWVVLAAFLVGCGFMTKMLQAWMVLPAFVVAYLVGREASCGRKLADLGAAAAMLIVSSFWWVAATMARPSPKPHIGGSEDGSAWDLIFGYNGFGRVFGGSGNVGPGAPGGRGEGGRLQPGAAQDGQGAGAGMSGGGPGGGGFSGEPGILRFANEALAGQISWLLPLSTVVLAAMLVAAVLRRRSGIDRRYAAGWELWGGWLVVGGLTFSFAQGVMHPHYTTMLAPAVGAVAGAGLVRLWSWYREPSGGAWLLLPLGVVVTVVWAVVVVLRTPDWNGWAGWAAAVLGALAVIALVVARRRTVFGKAALALAIAAVLLVPAVWSAGTAFAGQSAMEGMNPMAGPELGTGAPGAGPVPSDHRPGGGQLPGGSGLSELSGEQRRLLDFATANTGDAAVPLAVEGGAMFAATYLISSEVTVVGMGGFMGTDDAPSAELLTRWQEEGGLGYVLLGGRPGPGGAGFGSPGTDPDAGAAQAPGMPSMMPGGTDGAGGDRTEWVRRSCALVDPAAYGSTVDTGALSAQQLYDCRR